MWSGYCMQEQVHVDAQTTHSPNLGPAHRLRLSAELLDPLCHGLGHAIYRLVMASSQQFSTGAAGRQDAAERAYQHTGSPTGAASSGPALLSLVAGEHVGVVLLEQPFKSKPRALCSVMPVLSCVRHCTPAHLCVQLPLLSVCVKSM